MSISTALLAKLRAMIFLFWSFVSTFSCYYVLFFESDKHIAPSTIGMLIAVYTIATMFGQYFWGYICDRLESVKKPFLIMAVLSLIIDMTFPLNNSIWTLFPAMALLGFVMPPMSPLSDSWSIKHLAAFGKERMFGSIRAFGSLGWALTACGTAYMISWFGWNIMYAEGCVAALLMLATAAFIDDISLKAVVQSAGRISPLAAARELLSDRAYVFILIVMFFHFFGYQTAYNYLGLIIKKTGGSVIHLGYTYLLSAGSEVPTMFFSIWLLKRMAPKHILLIAIFMYIARFATVLYFHTSTAVMLTAIMEGIGFGLMLTALRSYIFAVAPEHLKTMAFTVGEAFYINLAVIIGGILGGMVVEYWGVYALITASTLFCCLSWTLLATNCILHARK